MSSTQGVLGCKFRVTVLDPAPGKWGDLKCLGPKKLTVELFTAHWFSLLSRMRHASSFSWPPHSSASECVPKPSNCAWPPGGSLSFGRIEVTDEFPAIAASDKTETAASDLAAPPHVSMEPNAGKEPKAPKEPRDPKNPPGAAARPAAPTAPPKASAAGVTVARVPLDEPPKLAAAEIAACQVAQEVTPVQARVMDEAKRLGLSSAMFWRVRSDYYEQELPWRRDVLGASSVQQLCKSMIMENTKLTPEEAAAAGRIKYVCFVLQYAGSKLNKEKMHDAVRAMEGAKAVGKKQYSIRMVSPEISDSLSGYPHNAVTPLGMAHPVPVLLSHKLKSLPDAQLWLGGGEVDLKMRVDVTELMTKLVYEQAGRPPIFADITED